MVLGLPENNTEASLNDMISTFVKKRSHYMWSLLRPSRPPQKVSLKLPRVSLDSGIVDLIPVGKNMCDGQMKAIFRNNGMKNLCKNSLYQEFPSADVYVSDYVSRCALKIDEEGATAAGGAAAVVTFRSLGALQPPLEFHCNRPFMASIMRDNEIFFIAIITGQNIQIFDS